MSRQKKPGAPAHPAPAEYADLMPETTRPPHPQASYEEWSDWASGLTPREITQKAHGIQREIDTALGQFHGGEPNLTSTHEHLRPLTWLTWQLTRHVAHGIPNYGKYRVGPLGTAEAAEQALATQPLLNELCRTSGKWFALLGALPEPDENGPEKGSVVYAASEIALAAHQAKAVLDEIAALPDDVSASLKLQELAGIVHAYPLTAIHDPTANVHWRVTVDEYATPELPQFAKDTMARTATALAETKKCERWLHKHRNRTGYELLPDAITHLDGLTSALKFHATDSHNLEELGRVRDVTVRLVDLLKDKLTTEIDALPDRYFNHAHPKPELSYLVMLKNKLGRLVSDAPSDVEKYSRLAGVETDWNLGLNDYTAKGSLPKVSEALTGLRTTLQSAREHSLPRPPGPKFGDYTAMSPRRHSRRP
ncbi:MAG: hypothetical protein HOQ05_08160 [Corynebacteriales bacterium]|nr:hypothetical protein [Mycobacteriales bacterium]